MPVWLVQLIVSFVVRQVLKWGTQIDWSLVAKDFSERVRDLLPARDYEGHHEALATSFIHELSDRFRHPIMNMDQEVVTRAASEAAEATLDEFERRSSARATRA